MGFQKEKMESAAQLTLNRNKHLTSPGPVWEGWRGCVCFRFSLCLFEFLSHPLALLFFHNN